MNNDLQAPGVGSSSSNVMFSRKYVLTIGVVLAFLAAPVVGLVYGIPLLFKNELRDVGLIVIGIAVLWTVFTYWLALSGYAGEIFRLLTF